MEIRKYREKDIPAMISIWNKVVEDLYERLGFVQIGIVPKGFRMKDGTYQNICLYYYEL